MDDLLTTVSTSQVKRPSPVTLIEESSRNGSEETQKLDLQSPEEISKALKNKPSSATLNLILRHLVQDSHEKDGFNLAVPGPISAQIVDTLITTTIPDFWPFSDARNMGKALVRCLQNANGLGALISRLRVLILDARQKKSMEGARDSPKHIEDLLDVFEHVLRGSETSSQIWKDVDVHAPNAIQKKLMWKEYVAQMASGRILSLVAEAEDILKEGKSTRKQSWLANGEDYATWLGQNVATLMKDNVGKKESSSAIAEICSKGLGLGYTGMLDCIPIVAYIFTSSRCSRESYGHFDHQRRVTEDPGRVSPLSKSP
jgi:telomere length regulation protein